MTLFIKRCFALAKLVYLSLLCAILISSCGKLRTAPDACLECHGSGCVHKPCAWCNSTGICHACKGTGYISCPHCINGGQYIDKKWQKCSVCQGKGSQWKSCYLCGRGSLLGGTGICNVCRSEYVKCIYCNGTGKNTNIVPMFETQLKME